ncbi:hypothetical protein ILUMI_06104, partial [Ignelater luminosus]
MEVTWSRPRVYSKENRLSRVADNSCRINEERISSPKEGLPVMIASRMQHYVIFLQGFDFKICYKNSKLNTNADVFSRFPVVGNANESTLEESDMFEISQIQLLPITVDGLGKETALDAELGPLLLQLQENVNVPQAVKFR